MVRTSPTLLRFIKKVYQVKGIGVSLPERIQLLTEEYILLSNIGEEKCELGLVGFLGKGMCKDLVQGCADEINVSYVIVSKETSQTNIPLPPPMSAT